MSPRLPSYFLVLAVLPASGCDRGADEAAAVTRSALAEDDPRVQAVLAIIDKGLDADKGKVAGAALALLHEGELAFIAGRGVRSLGGSEPVDADTLFRLGSISKSFTAAAVLSLARDGRLALHRPVTDYVPSLRLLPPHDPSKITVAQLLTHRSGLPDAVPYPFECPETLAGFFAARPELTQWAPAGRLYNYSNLGFSLAGLVAESAGGQPFRVLVQQRIFDPLGMHTATYDPDAARATGNYATATPSSGGIDDTFTRCEFNDPNGYLYASAADLSRFAKAFLRGGGRALDPLSVLSMQWLHAATQQAGAEYYGYGLFTWFYKGVRVVLHPGALSGYRSLWAVAPERGFGVVLLLNGDPALFGLDAVLTTALDQFLAPAGTSSRRCQTPATTWTRYIGTYTERDEPAAYPQHLVGMVRISLEKDKLIATVADGTQFEMVQLCKDHFLIAGSGFDGTFLFDRSGRSEYLATRIGVFTRTMDAAPWPAAPLLRGELLQTLQALRQPDTYHPTDSF